MLCTIWGALYQLCAYMAYEPWCWPLAHHARDCAVCQVEVRVNMGKDFSRDTIEVTGTTDPGGYIAFSGIDYDLYSRGGNIFLTEEMVCDVTPQATDIPLFTS